MGTVHSLPARTRRARPPAQASKPKAVTVEAAVDAFLDTFRRIDQHGTCRTYGNVLRQVQAAPVLEGKPVAVLDDPATAEQLRGWFTDKWGDAAPATWNRNRAAPRAAVAYWQTRKWITTDPTTGLERATVPPNRTRARGRTSITTLLERKDIPLRERTLWSLLYESTARAEETLLLDIGDLDLPNRRAVVHRKGGATDEITWQTRTARLLARYIAGRTRGPVFLTNRAARVQLAAADLDPDTGRARLSYRRAEELFKEFSGGWTRTTCATADSPMPPRTACPPRC